MSGAPAPEPSPPVERRRYPVGPLVLGLLLVAVGVAWLVETLDVVEVPWGALLPIALIVVGVALILAAQTGGHGGLVAAGVVLTVLTVITAAIDFPLRGGVGERLERPTSVGELEESYDLAIGQLTLDLTTLGPISAALDVEANLGMGELVIEVPQDLVVRVRAEASVGDVQLFDEEESGVGPEVEHVDEAFGTASGRVSIDASVGLGSITVER